MTIQDRITKAKVKMLIKQPFYGQLACQMIPMQSDRCPTMGVDMAGNLYFNEEFAQKLSDDEMIGVMAHEILHLAYLHPARVGELDPTLWNIACDIKVNRDIGSIFTLPKTGIIPKGNTIKLGNVCIKDIDSKTTEEIYKELSRNATKVSVSINSDGSISATFEDGDGNKQQVKINKDLLDGKSKQEVERLAKEWKEKVSMALQNSKQKGNVPAGFLREIAELETPKLKWDRVIRERFLKSYKVKSWQKVNKKWLPDYFAGTKKNKTLNAFLAIDTSGSMGNEELAQIKSEIWGLANTFKGFKLHIACCDADLYDVYELTEKTKQKFFDIKLKGGGGTSFKPVFSYIKKKMGDNIDCLVYFTDGYGDFPNKKPSYQVYWVINNKDITVPFGKYIYLQ